MCAVWLFFIFLLIPNTHNGPLYQWSHDLSGYLQEDALASPRKSRVFSLEEPEINEFALTSKTFISSIVYQFGVSYEEDSADSDESLPNFY